MLLRCSRTGSFCILRTSQRVSTSEQRVKLSLQSRAFFSRSSSRFSGSGTNSGDASDVQTQTQGLDGVTKGVAGAGEHELDSGLYPLTGLISELDRAVGAPRFEIDGARDVTVLTGPVEFYEVLKEKILAARRRIFLSTLYIGKTEHELITTIRTALQKNTSLTVSFLTDALRGTRETPKATTASLLAPLIQEFGSSRVQVRMYHTPNLTGLKKKALPQRINEGWGLQHMKLYGIDDEIIMSGANLSNDYFTNRQDRYHVFSSRALTEYYERIHQAVSSISFDIQPPLHTITADDPGYRMSWPQSNGGPSPLVDPKQYIAHAAALLGPIIKPYTEHTLQPPLSATAKTVVYPVFSLPPLLRNLAAPQPPASPKRFGSTELPALTVTLLALKRAPFNPATVTFTAGYFNPTSSLITMLLSAQAQRLTVLAASPYANGFYGSSGVSGLLPPAYTLLCKRFLRRARSEAAEGSVSLMEWKRGMVGEEGGWTYHAKGVWVTLPSGSASQPGGGKQQEQGPCITLVGSSNYTARAYSLDLEANALVLTRDPVLQARLAEEEKWLQNDAEQVTLEGEYSKPERRVGLKVRIAMWITTLIGGAL